MRGADPLLPLRIGIDTGGTFTDLPLVVDAAGATYLFKLASTPADLSEAIGAGLLEGLRRTDAALPRAPATWPWGALPSFVRAFTHES